MTLHIDFERTGGVAGPAARRSVTINADALPAGDAEELHRLVQDADVPAIAGRRDNEGASARPDAFRYRLVLDIEGQRHTIEVGETDVPASLRPLIRWLTRRSQSGA